MRFQRDLMLSTSRGSSSSLESHSFGSFYLAAGRHQHSFGESLELEYSLGIRSWPDLLVEQRSCLIISLILETFYFAIKNIIKKIKFNLETLIFKILEHHKHKYIIYQLLRLIFCKSMLILRQRYLSFLIFESWEIIKTFSLLMRNEMTFWTFWEV